MALEIEQAIAPDDIFKDEAPKQEDILMILGKELITNRIELERAEALVKRLSEVDDQCVKAMSDQMIAKGVKSLRMTDGVLLTSTSQPVWYILSEKKEDFLGAVEVVGDAGMIKKDIPWQTLQSYLKKMVAEIGDNSITPDDKQNAITKFDKLKDYLKQDKKNNIQVRGLKII